VKHILLYVSVILALFVSSGCMKVGPDFHRPDTGIRIPTTYQYAPAAPVTLQPQERWWEVFNDPELNQIVTEALKTNLDIKRATARVLQVRSQFVQTRAERFPTVGIDGEARRQERPIIGVIPGRSSSVKTDIFTLSLPASFELDLWGRLARAEEAARADLLRAEETRHTVAQTVVAETVSLYLLIESLERRIQITEQSIKTFRLSQAFVENRYERGLTSILDVRQARRILAGAEAILPSLRQDLGIAQQNLAVLLGRYPKARPPQSPKEDFYKRLAPVPPNLPSDLLLRRPDIRAAEAELKALNALVGVAKASRFPRITLTGSYGYSSDELSQLFEPESALWSLAMGVVQPLFDAGTLKARQRGAEARYEEGVAEYAKALLTAFSEVESALLTREEQLKRRDRLLNFLTEARATQRVAQDRYIRGLEDYLVVLDAQQTRFQAEQNMVDVDLAIMNNRVTLHRALGGGWGTLPPVDMKDMVGPRSYLIW
jgi:multidrug efflux system outer membrane protein